MSEDYELPGVDMTLLRAYVAACVDTEPEARRLALVAALERGDATLHELDGDRIGVKVAGAQYCIIHRSRLRRPQWN